KPELEAPGFDPSRVEQVADHPCQPIELPIQALEPLRLRGTRIALQRRDRELEGGERVSEIVGDSGEERELVAALLNDHVDHLVEALGELPRFGERTAGNLVVRLTATKALEGRLQGPERLQDEMMHAERDQRE